MLRNRVLILAVVAIASASIQAAEHEIRLDEDLGAFQLEFLRIAPGDTVKFEPQDKPSSVNTRSVLVQNGAHGWRRPPGKSSFAHEGLYVFQSDAQQAEGMLEVAQVGRAVNLAQTEANFAQTKISALLARNETVNMSAQQMADAESSMPAEASRPPQTAATQSSQPPPAVSVAQATSDSVGPAGTEKEPSASTTPRPDAELAELTVYGFRRQYKVSETNTALGMDADILSTPLSVTVIPMDLLDDQQINNVEDALRNIAGVTRFKEGNGGEEKFSIRGFDASRNLFIDGARLNNEFNATNIATTETANIDRFEVLKGPSAILFGQGLPGGIINYVTKKPSFKPYAAAELIVGNFGFKRAELDLTRPINDSIAWRGVVSYEDSDGFRDFDSRKRYLIYPAVTLNFGNQTRLDLSYSYIRDRYTQDRGQALEQTADGRFRYADALRPDMFLGVPGWNDRTNSTYQRPSLNLTHEFGENWRLELIAAATKVEKELFDSSPDPVRPDGTVEIFPGYQEGTGKTRYLRLNNEWSFGDPKRIEHRLLLSVYEDSAKNDLGSAEVTGSGSVVFDPRTRSYSETVFSIDPSSFDFSFSTDQRERAVSFQDLITFKDKYVLLLGASRNRFDDRISGDTVSATNPRIGLIYKATPSSSYYASYSRGFLPSTGFDRDGNALKPERLAQVELGAKYELLDRKLQVSGALFDIRERNQAVTDPTSLALPPNQQWSIALGETRTRGLELQLLGEVGRHWRVIAGYSYLDSKLVDDGPDLNNDGNRLGGIPKHSGSLWAIHEFDGPLKGLGLGGGVFAQSRVPIGFENRSYYDSWTQIDLAAFYKWDKWKLQFNAKNVTDEEYLLTQALAFEDLASVRVGTATPRTYTFSLAREF